MNFELRYFIKFLMITKKNIFKLTAILLLLAGSFYSCNNDRLKEGEYEVVCATITELRAVFCPAVLVIESDKPIANTSPINGYVHFFAGDLPSEFRLDDGQATATIVFRLTGETIRCFVEAPVIDIISFEKCE